MRQKFEIFRHVVFDYGGDYYVAVPLDAPRNRNPKEQQDLLAEAHLLSNLFSSFEKEKIFKRVYSPLLRTASIQRKLARQGSKFANCRAFRIYRFADGAWSEIILGAVMGAAKRVEAEKRNRQPERDAFELPMSNSGAANVRDAGRDFDRDFDRAPASPLQHPVQMRYPRPAPSRPPAAPSHTRGQGPGRPQQSPMPVTPAQDTAAAFGPYAAFQPQTPAPSRRDGGGVTSIADEIARREADVTVHAPTSTHLNEIVVPMPARIHPSPPVERQPPSGVDVEMTRETIRYTLPGDQTERLVTKVPTTEAVLPAALARLTRADQRPLTDSSELTGGHTLRLVEEGTPPAAE